MSSLGGKSLTNSEIESIEVNPDPPKPGKNLTVTVHGTANERIEVSSTSGSDAMLRACLRSQGDTPTHKH